MPSALIPSPEWKGIPESFLTALNSRFLELSGGSVATAAGSVAGLFFRSTKRPDANGTPVGTFGAETDTGNLYQVQTVGSAQVWVSLTPFVDDGQESAAARTGGLGTHPLLQLDTIGGTQPTRYGKLVNDNNAYWTMNVSYDGTNWNLDDISRPGMSIAMVNGTLFFSVAPAAANPAVFAATFTMNGIANTLLGNLDLTDVTKGYKVGGTKVVGAQGAAVTAPSGAGAAGVDTPARNSINALISRLQAHGLIA